MVLSKRQDDVQADDTLETGMLEMVMPATDVLYQNLADVMAYQNDFIKWLESESLAHAQQQYRFKKIR